MNTGECIGHIVQQWIAVAGERPDLPKIDGIDFHTVAEDDGQVMVSVHFADPEEHGGLPICGLFDLASAFEEEFRIALFAASCARDFLRGEA